MKTDNLILNNYGRHAHSHHLKPMLGIEGNAKLPSTGMPAQEVQGVVVYVKALDPNRVKYHKTHRVMAVCPVCSKHVSAGRLFQHMTVHAT